MSQSQDSQSSKYHSSITSSAFRDSLGIILPSEGSSAGFHDASSYGQVTPISTPIIQPFQLSAVAPPHLERVGPTRKEQLFILWTEEMNDDVFEWWLKTDFGAQR